MAERSTAAVDVADTSGDQPLTAKAEQATADGVAQTRERDTADDSAAKKKGRSTPPGATTPPELHSGHKLARRYRLEECVTRLDGFSSWRAVDEKLRRAVGVHVLPADHPRARSVLAAARSAALLGDPRFVQVLDAVEENDLVYVVHEWLPDATELTTLLASGPLEAHDAYQLVHQVAQAMAAAHREGLSHLRLTPGAVLRTSSGQYRIRGLAVNAALRGISSETPQRTDTEAVGALLYAALTQRWPYENDAHGLSGLPKDVGLIPPDQVRAGVHRGLSELCMRALVNDGATASRQEPACATPDDLVKAIGEMPRVRPPEPAFAAPPEYQRPSFQQGSYGRTAQPPGVTQPVPPPPPLQSRTGKALKWAVSALLIAALGLGSWQLADALMDRDGKSGDSGTTRTSEGGDKNKSRPGKPIQVANALASGIGGAFKKSYENGSSLWRTSTYQDGPRLAPYQPGAGIVYDLGSTKEISDAEIELLYSGDRTSIELYASDSMAPKGPVDSMKKLGKGSTTGSTVKLRADAKVKTRYVLLWVTEVPRVAAEQYREPGFRQAIKNVRFKGFKG
ncbi:serine/threonine protein kinase [Streptomyces longispororuber]|uniref:Serine/threonine protein kinase n=1 Tax=Streptomyces longispororuber TaxID=68230 RepID=A0A918ZAN3_9ACTN|nr:protein kinase family protein [Streptomyces longispororuber]GHE42353.1 serine/threonine protein kinase [Streptomyces longispororuber]